MMFGKPAPGRTMFAGVHALPAAHALTMEPGSGLRTQRYWSPLTADSPTCVDDAAIITLRKKFDRAVAQEAAIHDGRSGLLLSGGVDSTYLLARLEATGRTPVALTVRFPDAPRYNEDDYARFAAESFDCPHQLVSVSEESAAATIEQIVFASTQPMASWSAVSQLAILKHARREGIDRLWSGLGSDEIFGGYDDYLTYHMRLLRRVARRPPPAGMQPLLDAALSSGREARRVLYPSVAQFATPEALRPFLAQPMASWDYHASLADFYRASLGDKPEANPMELMVAHEMAHRIPDLLLSMFEGLARQNGAVTSYPYLSPDLVAMASGFSPQARFHALTGRLEPKAGREKFVYKWPMYCMANGRVPPQIMSRRRLPFHAPFTRWMRSDRDTALPIRKLFDRTIDESAFWKSGLLDRAYLDGLVREFDGGNWHKSHAIWALWTLAAWYDRFIVDATDPA
jgi:asparagine synthase (glutamine-hydrolysing)